MALDLVFNDSLHALLDGLGLLLLLLLLLQLLVLHGLLLLVGSHGPLLALHHGYIVDGHCGAVCAQIDGRVPFDLLERQLALPVCRPLLLRVLLHLRHLGGLWHADWPLCDLSAAAIRHEQGPAAIRHRHPHPLPEVLLVRDVQGHPFRHRCLLVVTCGRYNVGSCNTFCAVLTKMEQIDDVSYQVLLSNAWELRQTISKIAASLQDQQRDVNDKEDLEVARKATVAALRDLHNDMKRMDVQPPFFTWTLTPEPKAVGSAAVKKLRNTARAEIF